MVYLLFGYFLLTYNLIKKRVLLDLNVLKKVGIIPISHKSLSATYIKSQLTAKKKITLNMYDFQINDIFEIFSVMER